VEAAPDHDDSLSEESRFGLDGRGPVAMLMIPPFNSLELHLPQENCLPEGQGS